MINEERIRLEQRITMMFVQALLNAGYAIDVDDGEEIILRGSTEFETIHAAMFSTDENVVSARSKYSFGSMLFVYGNDPHEVLSDYSMTLAEFLAPVEKYVEELFNAS